jgi:hypothetical protein
MYATGLAEQLGQGQQRVGQPGVFGQRHLRGGRVDPGA